MTAEDIQTVTRRGVESLAEITGRLPSCAAAPGWRCNDLALREQATFPFLYQSDCRGRSVFLPNVAGRILNRPQVPVTLPTYDELIGRGGVRDDNYNEHLLALLDPVGLNVLTVHAEVEGIARHELFQDFLDRARSAGVRFVPLADLIPRSSELPFARIDQRTLPGRQGLVACQGPTEGSVPWPGLEHQTAEGHAQ